MNNYYTIAGDPTPRPFSGMRRLIPGDRLFLPMNDLHIFLAAISHAASSMADGRTHKSPNPLMQFNTRQLDYAFVLAVRNPLMNALLNKSPPYIEIGMIPNGDLTLEDAKVGTSGFNTVLAHTFSSIFIIFFERHVDWLDDTYGAAINWHPTLDFCRVVRNAAAHGSIYIKNPQAPSVTWRGLSFGPADNGRQIMGNELCFGDILGLMFDAAAELDRINAPVL
jgi:hypothetical protein